MVERREQSVLRAICAGSPLRELHCQPSSHFHPAAEISCSERRAKRRRRGKTMDNQSTETEASAPARRQPPPTTILSALSSFSAHRVVDRRQMAATSSL